MITFSSAAGADVDMLDAQGERLLDVIGRTGMWRGVITAAQAGDAIARLHAAGAAERSQQPLYGSTRDADVDEQRATEVPITLRQRAFPLMQLLKRAQAADQPVLWGM